MATPEPSVDEKLTKIHERVDSLYDLMVPLTKDVSTIKATCGPCKAMVMTNRETLYGNGKTGLVTEVATLKSGRTDTLSVKSVCILVGTISSAWGAAIGAAMAAFAK